jgi:hypothetical protein
MPSGLEETLVAFPPRRQIKSASSVRSTLIISSLAVLKERGHFDRYIERLDPAHRSTLLDAIAGTWLPLVHATAHYTACEALGLPVLEQNALFHASGKRSQGSMLGTAVLLAKGAGVTPWTLLGQLDRLFRRGFEGAAVAAFRRGPKEGRAEAAGLPLLRIPYFRRGLGGVLESMLTLFCKRAYVVDLDPRPTDAVAYRVQWA